MKELFIRAVQRQGKPIAVSSLMKTLLSMCLKGERTL